MKIENNTTATFKEFGKLEIGDLFIDPKNFSDGDILMRINEEDSIFDSVKHKMSQYQNRLAINLTANEIFSYSDSEIIFPVEGKLVIE